MATIKLMSNIVDDILVSFVLSALDSLDGRTRVLFLIYGESFSDYFALCFPTQH